MSLSNGSASPKWRSIALPIEHGGWGFTIEPIVLGLLVVPSASAWEISVAALAVFLARRPFKLVATDVVRRRWLPRSKIAAGFAGLYGAVALAGLIGAVVTADAAFWSPLLIAAPLGAIAIYADAHSRSRALVAELSGAVAMGATVSMIGLAGGEEPTIAFGLWLALAARAMTSIALVRGQIRRVHEKPVGESIIYSVQLIVLVGMIAAAIVDVVPWLSAVAIAAIGALAFWSLRRPPVAAKTVGWTQIVVGLGVVLLTAVGFWVGW